MLRFKMLSVFAIPLSPREKPMPKAIQLFTLIGATLLFAAGPASAEAQSCQGPHSAPHGGPNAHMTAMINKMDANGNGSISPAELTQGSLDHARDIDTDGNGVISVEELVAMHQRRQKAMAGEHLAAADTDGDDQTSIEEFAQHHTERMMRMDRNTDGQISTDEIRPPHACSHGPRNRP